MKQKTLNTTVSKPVSESKHTPGPWGYDQTRGNNIYEYRVKAGKGMWDKTIADLDGDKPEVTKANARLISAAPDMLEALKQLYNAVKDIPEVKDYLDGNLIQANEAILKATNNQ